MLSIVNLAANAVIFVLSLWAVLAHRVPTKSLGAFVLMFMNLAAIGNIGAPVACHSAPEVLLNVLVASAALWGFWQVQVKHRVIWGHHT